MVALEKMVKRLQARVAFAKRISEQTIWGERIADARIDIEMTRLLCLKAADICACARAEARLRQAATPSRNSASAAPPDAASFDRCLLAVWPTKEAQR